MAEEPNAWLSTAALHPDMILAEAVISTGGMLLAQAGTPLTRRHLRQMRHWGIAGAQIATQTAEDTRPLPPSVVSQWLAIDERDPFMHALADVARDRYARHQREAATREGSRT